MGSPAPRTRLCSRDGLKQLSWFHLQCMRQYDDVDEPDVALAALNSTDVVAMQVRELCQRFLRKAALRPQFANASAKEYARVRASHLQLSCGVNTMSSTH